MMTMFAVAIILENAFVLGFSADTRSIERDYATLPLTLGPVTVPLIYRHRLRNLGRADPRGALADFADRALVAICAPARPTRKPPRRSAST